MHTPLSDLFGEDEFLRRHIGPTSAQQQEMAQAIGYDSVDALIDATIPAGIRRAEPLQLPGPRREVDVLTRLRDMASRNQLRRSHIGMGYYGTYTPAVIQRNVLENPGWYTAYTPYQAEISQGRLEALLTYQQMVMDLTGMELANASMLDEATAAAEAMTLLQRVNRQSKSNVFLVDADCHPQTLAVLETRARPLGIEVHVGNAAELIAAEDAFGLLLSYPGSSGAVQDIEPLISAAHATHTLVAVATDLLALTLLRGPVQPVPTWSSATASASACPWATAARTRRSSPRAMPTSAPRRDASSASRRTATVTRRCAWRCRPASSTSAAKRPPAISAPRRRCSR
jgi:glycine dehydrogenase